ncbi:MAG: aldose 1-epimerase [Alphaproteobacteria bacterium]|nr:aldose 1-epimerase [Alphaproteobacteria bacterium]
MSSAIPSVTPPLVALKAGPFSLDLVPEIGGAIVGLRAEWNGGVELLRRMPDAALAARDIRQAGSYSLIPYSNRMRECTLNFAGRRHRLAPNFGGHPHSIHGNAWQRAWRVESIDESNVTLAFDHSAHGALAVEWPFAYSARQRFALSGDGLEIAIEIANTGDAPMPAGMGLHPFFPRGANTRLTARTQSVWRNDEAMMPMALDPVPPAWNFEDGRLVAPLSVDNCFAGWSGSLAVEWPESGVRLDLTADPVFGHLVVFVPPGRTFFCVEPVSHCNDGMNLAAKGRTDTGVVVLAPGESLSGWVLMAFSRIGSPTE